MSILEGVKILDFTRLLPGPLATHLLAGMGAEVIKIESPRHSDYVRKQAPFVQSKSTLFESLNQSKSQLSISFDSPEGKRQLTELIKESDVFVEQFRPGVMARLGWDYERVKSINPRIVYVSLTGYGQTGPLSHYAGHDLNYLAYSGVLDLNRDGDGRPVIPGIQIADIGSGAYLCVSACLLGLLRQSRGGEGGYFDVSMLDGLLPMMTLPLSQHWGGWNPRQLRLLSGGLVNYNVYECEDGKWVALGALELKFWNRFCEIIGKPEWKRRQQLELSSYIFPKGELEALFKTRPRDAWVALVGNEDVCLSPILEINELESNAQIQARQMLGGGTFPFVSQPIKGKPWK